LWTVTLAAAGEGHGPWHLHPRHEEYGGGPAGGSEGEKRFDREEAQRILRRAAQEQTRQEGELAESYTLQQLQEIAREAGISPDAVRAAALEGESVPDDARPSRLRRTILIAAGAALLGLLVFGIGVGPTIGVVTIAVLLLVVLLLLLGLS
jgi:Flp pilus assembly protein TadB